MTFPLPDNTCRIVCRPKRKVPRRFRTKDVVRVALAAVENGEDPCGVVDAISEALPCEDRENCDAEAVDLDEASQALQEDLDAVLKALKETILAVGGLPELESPPDDEAWWQKWYRRLGRVFKVVDVLRAVFDLAKAANELQKTIYAARVSISKVLACLEKGKP